MVNETKTEKLEGLEVRRSGEMAVTAAAETAKAMVQARFLVALNRPRNIDNVRVELKQACERTRFAEMARFRKPQFGAKACFLGIRLGCPLIKQSRDYGPQCHHVCGPSIRFSDESIKLLGNVDIRQEVVYEDEDQRLVQVSATDLETNLTKSQTVCVKKTLERKKVRKGQEIIGQRENTRGDTVYIIRASDDELITKEANYVAKARRNLELQLLPQDIIEECMDTVVLTLKEETEKDPSAARKRVCDSFAGLGVKPSDLADYLGHSLESCSPAELQTLREMFASIRDGNSTWKDYMEVQGDENAGPERASADLSDITAGNAEGHTDVTEPIAKPAEKEKAQPESAPAQNGNGGPFEIIVHAREQGDEGACEAIAEVLTKSGFRRLDDGALSRKVRTRGLLPSILKLVEASPGWDGAAHAISILDAEGEEVES